MVRLLKKTEINLNVKLFVIRKDNIDFFDTKRQYRWSFYFLNKLKCEMFGIVM